MTSCHDCRVHDAELGQDEVENFEFWTLLEEGFYIEGEKDVGA